MPRSVLLEPLMKKSLNQSMPILTAYKIFINHKRGNIIFLSQRHCPSPSSARTSLSVGETVTNAQAQAQAQAQAHLEPQYCWRRREERGEGEGVVGGDQER